MRGEQFSGDRFLQLLVGQLLGALPLLAAQITRDPVAVSSVTAFAWLPWLVFSLPEETVVHVLPMPQAGRMIYLARNADNVARLGVVLGAGMILFKRREMV